MRALSVYRRIVLLHERYSDRTFLLHINPIFFICSDPDIGDKYSVFRQLEQPADKKSVGKRPFLAHLDRARWLKTHFHLMQILAHPCLLASLGDDAENLEMTLLSITSYSRNKFFFDTLIKLCVITWAKLSGHYTATDPCLHCVLCCKSAALIPVCFPSLFH